MHGDNCLGQGQPTEGHVDDGASLALLVDDVLDSPLVAVKDHGGVGSTALENLDVDDRCLLGHAVALGGDSARHVSAVAEGVLESATSRVVALGRTTLELDVGSVDSTVDNIGVRSLAGAAVVDVVARALVAVGNCAEAVSRAGLGRQPIKSEDLVLFNVGDLRKLDDALCCVEFSDKPHHCCGSPRWWHRRSGQSIR